ncbi:MAG: preprotein translocase subunit SecG [Oscillospiraceae bacterium]|nr:preprotein translocase subunit SecG [Oscillospiraceae bacterium]
MPFYQILLGAVLIITSIIIVVIVLLQQSRQAGLSGAVAGGAETFFGKNKGRTIEAKLARITKFVAIFFFILTIGAALIFNYIG